MNVHRYTTKGGKDLIKDYIDNLEVDAKAESYKIQKLIEDHGLNALKELNTRQLFKKLWEIKFSDNRLMYIVADENNFYIIHACKKQKTKAEKKDIDKAKKRVRELEQILEKKFL